MAAKNKDDIMDALLQGSVEDAAHETPSLAKLIHRSGEKTRFKHPGGSASGREKKENPGADSKKKSTHYLSEEIFADLDEARDKINKLVHPRLKAHVSKSRIVDQALRMILKDFDEKGEKSPLIKEILKSTRRK